MTLTQLLRDKLHELRTTRDRHRRELDRATSAGQTREQTVGRETILGIVECDIEELEKQAREKGIEV